MKERAIKEIKYDKGRRSLMKKLSRKQIINYVLCGVAGLSIIVALVFSVLMVNTIEQRMNDSATSNLLSTTNVVRDTMEGYLESDIKSLEIVGNIRRNGEEVRIDYVNALADTMSFDWIVVVDENGEGVDEFSGLFVVDDIPGHDEWTAQTSGYSDLYIGRTGRPQITLWSPIIKDGNYLGTVFGGVILTKYYSANVFTFYNGEGRTYLFDGNDGTWILRSLGTDGTLVQQPDIYALLAASGNSADDIAEFKAAIEQRKAGTVEFAFNSEESFLCFLPMHSSSCWYITTVISRANLLRESAEVRGLINIALVLSCAMLLFATIGFTTWFARKAHADEVRYRDTMFSNISENIESVFLIYEASSRKTVFVSNNITRLFGLSRAYLEEDAARLFDWCKIAADDSARNEFLNGELKGAISREVLIAEELDASSRTVNLELLPANHGQEIAVLTDITADKQIQRSLIDAMKRAEDASQAKNDFLSSMSHDLRTPINCVVGMTAIAAANIDDKNRVTDCLTKISESSENLLSLINEVLDMSQIESGRMELMSNPFNIAQLLQDVLSIGYLVIKKNDLQVNVRIGKIEHEEVIGDAPRLTRIANNLLSNAIKYTPSGGRIDLGLNELPAVIDGYGCYEILVSDNGIGMSEEFQKRLFKPFEREEDVRQSRIQGTGLGMSIVKEMVELMTGTIDVQSKKGVGTTVRVTVNLKLNENEPAKDARLEGLSVLVVDDDAVVSESISDILCGMGMKSEWVDSGEAAVKEVSKRRKANDDYFAIIIDRSMPGMDGIETARRVRKIVGKKTVIILSAFKGIEAEEAARKVGIQEFISKPLYKAKLYKKMTDIVAGLSDDKPAPIPRVIPPGKRVLLAEDNELNSEIAVELLKMIGIETDCADNGESVVEQFANSAPHTYDAVLMDIQMPKMNGYEATKAIRALEREDAKTVPILALTADAFKKDIQAAREAGMDEHIPKPISIELLTQKLKKFLASDESATEEDKS